MLVKGLNGVSLELAEHGVVITELRDNNSLGLLEFKVSVSDILLDEHGRSQKSHTLGLVVVLFLSFHDLVKDFKASGGVLHRSVLGVVLALTELTSHLKVERGHLLEDTGVQK